MASAFEEWAAWYASQGYAVLPLDGKYPVLVGPGVRLSPHKASADPRQHATWAAQYPGCNIGLAIPQGKVCFDIDPRNGGRPDPFYGSHPHAVQRSGGGGWHLIYDLPDPSLQIPEWLGTNVKAYGGYVAAAPSIHPETGNAYVWEQPLGATQGQRFPPAAIWATARERRVTSDDVSDHKQMDSLIAGMRPEAAIANVPDGAITEAVRAIGGICKPGQRYSVLTKMSPLLARLGWSAEAIERFARAAMAQYGAADVEHGVKGALNCMNHPSGYFDLLGMAGMNVLPLQNALDRLYNPFRQEMNRMGAEGRQQLDAVLAQRERPADTATLTGIGPVAGQFPAPPAPLPASPLGRRIDLNQVMPPIDYCVEGLPWHYDAVNAVVGYAAAGKTPFAAALAVALSTGAEFLGRQCRQGKTAVLAFESPRAFARHLQRYASANQQRLDNIDFFEVEPGRLATDPGYLDALRGEIAAQGYRHVILDTYNASCNGADPNDAKFAAPARALELPGVAVFLVVHTSKADLTEPSLRSIAGTGALAGAIKAAVGLWRPEEGQFEAVCVRTPERSFPPIRYCIEDVSGGWLLKLIEVPVGEEGEAKLSAKQEVDALVKRLPTVWDGEPAGTILTLAELVRRSRASGDDVVTRACTRLLSLGAITETRDGKAKAYQCDYRTQGRGG